MTTITQQAEGARKPRSSRRDTAARRADLTCLAIVTDPDLLADFLFCGVMHPELDLEGLLSATCCGHGKAFLLLPETTLGRRDSWKRRHQTVKPGAVGIRARQATEKGSVARTLFSEYDLSRPPEQVLSADDVPSPWLDPDADASELAMAEALSRAGVESGDVANALRLKYGLSLSREELGCPESSDVQSAARRCRAFAANVATQVPADFGDTLGSCLAELSPQGTERPAEAPAGPTAPVDDGSRELMGRLEEETRKASEAKASAGAGSASGSRLRDGAPAGGGRPEWADDLTKYPPPSELLAYFRGRAD